MKKYFASVILLAVSVTALPAVPVCFAGNRQDGGAYENIRLREVDTDTEKTASEAEAGETRRDEPYKVLDAASGEILEVSERDYVIGAVCAEMPASFSEEALKAQAVAAHTYAERQRLRERESPDPELMGADFSNDTSKYQGYFTKEQAMQYFGGAFEQSYAKICAAADEVMPYIITYDEEPIIAAFHSMSPGMTESAENAWGAHVDYLVEVDSSFDLDAPKYREEVRIEKDVLRNALERAFPGISLGEDMQEWLRIESVSDAGTVLAALAGDRTVTGNELRTALTLRSACFEIDWEDNAAVITTRGFGHGVGMSQYGADTMASKGSSWRDILSHYYPGCTISER